MQPLTQGFCAAAIESALSTEGLPRWKAAWQSPTVQIVDIQRYPQEVSTAGIRSCFYVAASDGVSLVWLVVPPGTEMEHLIAHFLLDIGCCVTLDEYALASAANGLTVVISQRITFSSNPLSLLGHPAVDSARFTLSSKALTRRAVRAEVGAGGGGHRPADIPTVEIRLNDLIDNPRCTLDAWSVTLRIAWKGREHRLPPAGGRGAAAPTHNGAATRSVVRCIGVDSNGDALGCSFFGSSALIESFDVGDCMALSNGSVAWDETGQPTQLEFNDQAAICCLPYEEAESRVRWRLPLRFVGATKNHVLTVQEVIQNAPCDTVASCFGTVRSVSAGDYVNTKRGRVLRVVVTLQDEVVPHNVLDVTLWGEIAESLAPQPEERWAFLFCTVKEFMRHKTLSSRSTTAAVKMATTSAENADAAEETNETEDAVVLPTPSRRSDTSTPSREGEKHGPLSHAREGPNDTHCKRFVVSVWESSPTMPVLVRVQCVASPLLATRCLHCHHVADLRTVEMAFPCSSCGALGHAITYQVRLLLSDGVQTVQATGFSSVGLCLFEVTEAALLDVISTNPHHERSLCEQIVGTPLLMWLMKSAAADEECVIVQCKHVDLAVCAATLASTIDQALTE